jgi:hypothetical protein
MSRRRLLLRIISQSQNQIQVITVMVMGKNTTTGFGRKDTTEPGWTDTTDL